jgi:hypothetical protein
MRIDPSREGGTFEIQTGSPLYGAAFTSDLRSAASNRGSETGRPSESAKDKRARAAKHIRNRLELRSTRLGSFDYIRRTVNSDYGDDFLAAILDEFPDDFRRAQIKGGKPGIALNEDRDA